MIYLRHVSQQLKWRPVGTEAQPDCWPSVGSVVSFIGTGTSEVQRVGRAGLVVGFGCCWWSCWSRLTGSANTYVCVTTWCALEKRTGLGVTSTLLQGSRGISRPLVEVRRIVG